MDNRLFFPLVLFLILLSLSVNAGLLGPRPLPIIISNNPFDFNMDVNAIANNLYLRLQGDNQGLWTPTSTIVTNLNADLLDGRHEIEFLLTDGSRKLTADWNVGGFSIIDTNISASDIFIIGINPYTFNTVQDFVRYDGSSGVIDPKDGIITDGGSETVDTLAIKAAIRETDDHIGELRTFDLSVTTGNAIPTDTTRYIGVEYNFGSPQIVLKPTDTWNDHNEFPLGVVINESGTLHIVNNPLHIANNPDHIIHRIYETDPLQRANRLGGLILGETGTRRVTVTGGELYDRVNEFVINSIDTTPVGDTFDSYSSGGLESTGNTQWDNLNYDNSGTLTNLGANKYANLWFYVESDGDLVNVYGTAQHNNIGSALSEGIPVTIPDRLTVHGKLIGRIVFKQGGATAEEVQSVFTTMLFTAIANVHNNLSGLQGGTINEFFHFTGSENTELTAWLDDVVLSNGGSMNLGSGDLNTSGTITSSDITIFDATPILVFKDSDSLGAASVGFIEWRDSGGGRAGFLGNNTSGDDGFLWKNEQGGDIGIQTTGAGGLQIFAQTNIFGDLNTSGITVKATGQILVDDGTAPAPSYSFTTDPDSGFTYNSITPAISFIFGGNLVLSASATDVAISNMLTLQNGTQADPSFSFSGDADAGMYLPTSGEVAFVAGGAEAGRFTDSGAWTFTGAVSIDANSNQIVLDADAADSAFTVLTDSATAARVFTFPDKTGIGAITSEVGLLNAVNFWDENNTWANETKGTKESIGLNDDAGTTFFGDATHFLFVGDTQMSAVKGLTMIRDGSVVGISANYDITVTGGTSFTIDVLKNGSEVWSNEISRTVANNKEEQFTQARGTDTFSAGDTISVGISWGTSSEDQLTINDTIAIIEFYNDT